MPRFDRLDVCEAWYVFAMNNHGGQFTKEYKIFGRLEKIKFKVRPNIDVYNLSANAFEMYLALIRRSMKKKAA
jgi:hypothetical protein